MSTRRTLAGRLLLLALIPLFTGAAAGAPALRADPGLDLRYDMYWGGVPVAEVRLRHENSDDGYDAEFTLETKGMAKALMRYRFRAAIEGRATPAGDLQPLTYESRYKRRDNNKTSVVRFDPATGAIADVDITKRGQPQQPDLPADVRGLVDPLTAFLQLRRHLSGELAAGGEPATVRVFDGRRRYDLAATLLGRVRVGSGRDATPALRVELAVVPIAGFDDDELSSNGEGLRSHVLLSDDGRLVPLELRTLNAPVNMLFRLSRDCSPPDGCRVAAAAPAADADALRRLAA